MAEPDRLAQGSQPVKRPVRGGDLMADGLKLRMGVEDDLVGRRREGIRERRRIGIAGTGIDRAFDQGRNRTEATEL